MHEDQKTLEPSESVNMTDAATPAKTSESATPKMTARHVDVFYGDKQAINDVSIDVNMDSVTAFIGPSGCGKSTFLRCMNRMNDTIDGAHVSGSLKIDGAEVNDRAVDPVVLRASVGMVFQKPNPFPKSIYDNVAYGPRIHGLASGRGELDAIVEQSLRKAGLWSEVSDRLQDPGTAKIEDLIDELRENYCIIIVTHSMQQAARVSQMTAFFHMGSLIEVGPTEEIFTNPLESRTQDYITGRFG